MVRYKIVDLRLSEALGREITLDPDYNYAEDTPLGIKVYGEDFPRDTKLFFEMIDERGRKITARGYFYTIDGRVRGRVIIPQYQPPFVVQYSLGKITARFPKIHNKRPIIRYKK